MRLVEETSNEYRVLVSSRIRANECRVCRRTVVGDPRRVESGADGWNLCRHGRFQHVRAHTVQSTGGEMFMPMAQFRTRIPPSSGRRAVAALVVALTCGWRCATALAARGETPAAFGRRCIPADYVAPPSNIPDILGRRALSSGRLGALGASPYL